MVQTIIRIAIRIIGRAPLRLTQRVESVTADCRCALHESLDIPDHERCRTDFIGHFIVLFPFLLPSPLLTLL